MRSSRTSTHHHPLLVARGPSTALTVALALLGSPGVAVGQRPPPAQPLDSLRVTVESRTGDRGAAMRSVTVIDRAEIRRRAARTLADVIGWSLGVDVLPRSAAQQDLAIRGSSFEQVLVLVDGVRVSDDQTGHFDLDLAVPLEMVERVEVLRGSGSALYGPDAVGGVVNIVTRGGAMAPASRTRLTAAARGGSFGTGGASGSIAAGVPGAGVSAAAEYERSDGHRPDTDYRVSQARFSGARAVRAGTLALDLGIGVRDFGAADFYAAYPSHERTTAGSAALRWSAPVGSWSLASTVSARRHGDRFTLRRDDPSFYQNHHVSWQSGLEVVARRALAGKTALAVGAEGFGSWLRSERLGDRGNGRGAVFAETSVNGDLASGNAGLRADWSSRDGGVLSPSLAGRLRVRDGVVLRASAGRGFRAPTWTERYYEDPANVGDPELRPETFWTGELGARADLPAGFSLDLAAWARRAHDLIDWARPVGAPAGEPWRTRNVERATFRGLEGELRLPAWRDVHWSLRGAATTVSAGDAAGYVGKYALRPLTRSLSAHVAAPLGAGLTLAVDGGVAAHEGEARYARADARLSYAWRTMIVTLDAVNLGDASWLDASAQPVAGRALYLGVRLAP